MGSLSVSDLMFFYLAQRFAYEALSLGAEHVPMETMALAGATRVVARVDDGKGRGSDSVAWQDHLTRLRSATAEMP